MENDEVEKSKDEPKQDEKVNLNRSADGKQTNRVRPKPPHDVRNNRTENTAEKYTRSKESQTTENNEGRKQNKERRDKLQKTEEKQYFDTRGMLEKRDEETLTFDDDFDWEVVEKEVESGADMFDDTEKNVYEKQSNMHPDTPQMQEFEGSKEQEYESKQAADVETQPEIDEEIIYEEIFPDTSITDFNSEPDAEPESTITSEKNDLSDSYSAETECDLSADTDGILFDTQNSMHEDSVPAQNHEECQKQADEPQQNAAAQQEADVEAQLGIDEVIIDEEISYDTPTNDSDNEPDITPDSSINSESNELSDSMYINAADVADAEESDRDVSADTEDELPDQQNCIHEDAVPTPGCAESIEQEEEQQQETEVETTECQSENDKVIIDGESDSDVSTDDLDFDEEISPDTPINDSDAEPDAEPDSTNNSENNESSALTQIIASTGLHTEASKDLCVKHTVVGKKKYIEFNRSFVLSLACIILLTYLITATAFSCLRYTPRTAVEQYIANMEYSVEQNLNNDDDVDENLKEFLNLCFNSGIDVQCKFKNAVKNGDTATVDVVFTFKDNSERLENALTKISEANAAGNSSEDDFYKQLLDNFVLCMDYEDTFSKETVTFSLVKNGHCWIVDDYDVDDEVFYNVYFSNTFDIFSQMIDE